MFVLADRNGLGVDELADPAVACQLATLAVRSLSPWSTSEPAAAVRERALALYTDTAMVDAYQRAFVRILDHPFPGADQRADVI